MTDASRRLTVFLLAGFLLAGAAHAADMQAELIVWSGDKPAGQTWAKLGPHGRLAVEKNAGEGGGPGLVLHMDGDGYRGGGVNWKGWFPADAADDATPYNALVFHIRQVSKIADADLTVQLVDNLKRKEGEAAGNSVQVVGDGGADKIDGEWRRVVLPLDRFTRDKPLQLNKLWGIDFSNTGNQELTFQIDKIGFAVEKIQAPRFRAGPAYQAAARIDLSKPGREISDGIYGVCDLPREKLSEYQIRITRWGGNPSTRYNWKLGVDNGAADWYFKNRGALLERPADTGWLKTIERNQVIGATTYQTVPMIGWVAKDAGSYSFSVAKYGPQKATEPGHPDVGNGVKPDGSLVTGADPRDTSVEAPPEFIAEGVRFVVQRAGKADADCPPGVQVWALDNEPMLWHSTHRDVHPKPLGYDELWERTVKYATAIKSADPTAKVAGFCSWGWNDLYYSAADAGADNYRTRPDWTAHDKVGLAEWFIQKCGEYKKAHDGKALVDVFDIHWYPQCQYKGQGPYRGKGMSQELNALRLRSTRDLWDPKYEQESWIKDTDNYSPVALIPRVKKWIAAHNPGMELCVGEYNFGGGDNVTGGLAQAEVFGVLARENVDLAFIWYQPEGTQELAWRLFRSYDGKQGRFGDRWLDGESDNPDLSICAARRTKDGAVTAALVNKDLNRPCVLKLDLGKLPGKMRLWRFDQDTGDKVIEVADQAGAVDGTLKLTLPAASASMLVIAPEKQQ
jgi:Glycoside hydrolase family 44